jgi:hypothetical protein
VTLPTRCCDGPLLRARSGPWGGGGGAWAAWPQLACPWCVGLHPRNLSAGGGARPSQSDAAAATAWREDVDLPAICNTHHPDRARVDVGSRLRPDAALAHELAAVLRFTCPNAAAKWRGQQQCEGMAGER